MGRRHQLRQARALLAGCLEDGRGTTLCVRGESGVGKSRLLAEIETSARALGFAWLPALVLDFGVGASGGAIRALTSGLLGVTPGDPEGPRRALERGIDSGAVPAELGPFVLDLLDVPLLDAERQSLSDVDGSTRAELRLDALSELVRGQSRRRPLALSIEDIHWADSVTLAFVTRLIAVADEARCVLCLTTRSAGDPLGEDRGDFSPGALVRLDLGPLRAAEALELAHELGAANDETTRACVERAAGNPLFLEQLLESRQHWSAAAGQPSTAFCSRASSACRRRARGARDRERARSALRAR